MISETIQRLDTSVAGLKFVGGAAEFSAAAEANPKATPAAFVILLADGAQPSGQSTGGVTQQVAVTLGVVYVVRNVADPAGAGGAADIASLREAGRAALLGWQPVADADPYEFVRGSLLAFRDGHIWWQDVYRSAIIVRSEA